MSTVKVEIEQNYETLYVCDLCCLCMYVFTYKYLDICIDM